ncbi:malate:quinone oxidoreductase, partial [Campylobacter jejuni]
KLDKTVLKVTFNMFKDATIRNYIFYNYLFELPFVDKSLFVKDAKKIVPSLKASDIYYAKGFGGVRPQVIDKTKGELMLGEASITETPGIIFNMTPSPGATSCLGNAERDAKLVCNYLGMEFNEDKFSSELL